MRLRIVRAITISGFLADQVPGIASTKHITLDDWLGDQTGHVPTRGCDLRVRFLTAGGSEVLGGSVAFTVWSKSSAGFWVADNEVGGATSGGVYTSSLTGDLFVEVSSIDITDIPTAATLQILVQET